MVTLSEASTVPMALRSTGTSFREAAAVTTSAGGLSLAFSVFWVHPAATRNILMQPVIAAARAARLIPIVIRHSIREIDVEKNQTIY
jgi:hypothetical protein